MKVHSDVVATGKGDVIAGLDVEDDEGQRHSADVTAVLNDSSVRRVVSDEGDIEIVRG